MNQKVSSEIKYQIQIQCNQRVITEYIGPSEPKYSKVRFKTIYIVNQIKVVSYMKQNNVKWQILSILMCMINTTSLNVIKCRQMVRLYYNPQYSPKIAKK